MNPIQLLLLSIAIFGVGALLSLLPGVSARVARQISGLSALLASLVGVASSAYALMSVTTPSLVLFSFPSFWAIFPPNG